MRKVRKIKHYFVLQKCFFLPCKSSHDGSHLCCESWPLTGVLTRRLGTTALSDRGYTTCQTPILTSLCRPAPSSSASFTQRFQFTEKLAWVLHCGLRPRGLSVIYSGGWHALRGKYLKNKDKVGVLVCEFCPFQRALLQIILFWGCFYGLFVNKSFLFFNTQRPKSTVAMHTRMQRAAAKVQKEERQRERE